MRAIETTLVADVEKSVDQYVSMTARWSEHKDYISLALDSQAEDTGGREPAVDFLRFNCERFASPAKLFNRNAQLAGLFRDDRHKRPSRKAPGTL